MSAGPDADAAGSGGPDSMVVVRGLRKRFGTIEALRGVDLDVGRGEVVCILGPSGSGKSTLLRCVNHLERPTAGAVWVDGELIGYRRDGNRLIELTDAVVARQRARCGMVFQKWNLWPHMTVLDNVMEGPVRVLGRRRADARAQAETLLSRVGLADKTRAWPAQLSGGQQQRVAIARALAMEPALMLFDEPTSALDPELVGEVLDTMRDLTVTGITMMVVTHEIGFAREAADRVVFMDAGAIVEVGPTARVLSEPQHKRTRDFLAAVRA